MARAKSGGAAFAWALVVVGTGFFIFLILFIVYYTQMTKLQQDYVAAVDELDRYATRAQRQSTDVRQILSDLGNETVIRKMLDEQRRLKAIISAEPGMDTDAINKIKTEQRQIDVPLFTHIDRLNQEIDNARQQTETARQAQAAEEKRASQAVAERDALADQFRAEKDKIAESFHATGQKLSDAAAGYPAMEAKLREDMKALRSQMQEQIDELGATIEEQRAEISRKDFLIRKHEEDRSTTLGPPGVIPADGQIISLVADGNKVYIDRGADDYLQLGMTFEVFNADELIKLNDYDELRGKATVEVIDLDDRTAVARVVRKKRNQTITPNDQVANLIYDPSATYKFYVYGDFDIDFVGKPSTRDRDRIKSMITRWGGEVNDELNWDVDFLVLGKEPPLPDPLPEGEIDPTVIRAHAEATKNYDTYTKLANTARELSVPVLNQNRFLSLVGYYRR